MTIDDIAVSTVPTTDAITFTPHSRVISSLVAVVVRVVAVAEVVVVLFCFCDECIAREEEEEEEAILVMDGN